MKKIQMIQIKNLPEDNLNAALNTELLKMQQKGKEILNIQIIGKNLEEATVFITYDEDYRY